MTRAQFASAVLEPKDAAGTRGARSAADVLGELGGSHLALTSFLYAPGKGPDFKQVVLYDSEEAKLLEKDTKFLATPCSADLCQNCIRCVAVGAQCCSELEKRLEVIHFYAQVL